MPSCCLHVCFNDTISPRDLVTDSVRACILSVFVLMVSVLFFDFDGVAHFNMIGIVHFIMACDVVGSQKDAIAKLDGENKDLAKTIEKLEKSEAESKKAVSQN